MQKQLEILKKGVQKPNNQEVSPSPKAVSEVDYPGSELACIKAWTLDGKGSYICLK